MPQSEWNYFVPLTGNHKIARHHHKAVRFNLLVFQVQFTNAKKVHKLKKKIQYDFWGGSIWSNFHTSCNQTARPENTVLIQIRCHSVDPDQMPHTGGIWSGSTLFVCHRLDKSGYQDNIFLISPLNMLWVLIRSASARRF